MSEVRETMDYGIFKTVGENRTVQMAHVEKIKASIQKNNLIKDFPILIDFEYNVLDGQHRLAALKELGLPVYYKIAEVTSKADISLVNTISKKWTMDDYLHQYSADGNENYFKFRQFMEWSGCNKITLAIKFLKNKSASSPEKQYTNMHNGSYATGINGSDADAFKVGKFIYPADDSTAKNSVLSLKEISSFLKNKNPYDRSLIVAYDAIKKDADFSLERLIRKLGQYPIGAYKDALTLIDELEKAYNYNEPHKNKKVLRRK